MKTFKRFLVVAWLILTLLNLNGQVFQWFTKQPAIKRAGIRLMAKGFLSQWDFDWLIK